MKALLLAAGRATRLGSLSRTTPKCLHRIGDEVLLDRLVSQLREVGVTDFLINTHHLADQVVTHVERRSDYKDFTLVHEPELLGTLGTLKANIEFFGSGPGWVLHADNFIEGSLLGLIDGFSARPYGCIGAMLTFETDNPSACGVVVTDERSVVSSFFEKEVNPPSHQASAATFIFDSKAIRLSASLPPEQTDISRDLLPQLRNRIVAIPHKGRVIDIGTPEGLALAQVLGSAE